LLDACFTGFFDGVLDDRFIHNRQHFLGNRLGGGQETGSHSGHGEYSFADGSFGHGDFGAPRYDKGLVEGLFSSHGTAIKVQFFAGRGQLGDMTNRLGFRAMSGVLTLGLGLAVPVAAAPVATATFAAIDAALAAGDGSQALRLSDAALNLAGLDNTDRARLVLDRGLGYSLAGRGEDALADLTQAINTHGLTVGEQARAYLERGLVLDGMNRLDDAIGDYNAALRLNPESAPALNNRANAYRRQNRLEDAQRDYLASLAAGNPAPEYPYYGLGQVAEQQGKFAAAKNFYGQAIQSNPGYQLAANRLAALGGTVPVTPPIVLKPPPGTLSVDNAPIVLRPPPVRRAPPGRFIPAPASPASNGQSPRPAPPLRVADISTGVGKSGPGLRPALNDAGGQEVQLGAWRSEAEATAGWHAAVTMAGGILTGLSPHIVTADLPGRGRYYRLRVRVTDSKQLCAALTARGMDCFPARD
jgi:tetratricopeptide (TPR) repeat protein